MLPHLPSSLHLYRITPPLAVAAATTGLVAGGVLLYFLTKKKISPDEVEYQRRAHLAQIGRVTDGSIVGIDGNTEDTSEDGVLDVTASILAAPHVIAYRYRISGVTYECAQDVTSLASHVHHLRVDLPVQVRYDAQNPGNSIIVAESWSGVQHDTDQAFIPEGESESRFQHNRD